MYDNKSVPPVDAFAFNTIAVPSPTKIPPYMHANNLSSVRGFNFSNISIKVESTIVPNIPLIAISFPTYIIVNIINGIFNISIVIPRGILNK